MRIRSAAKINPVLNVLGQRADGYHELQTIMQSVSLYDQLEFARADALEVNAPAGLTERPEQNLVYRAARAFLAKYAPRQGVRITLTKNIPLAAGLAGGSTDCAGTLIGLNKFFALNRPVSELAAIAAALGSDIVYCLYGGAYLARGRGEILQKIPEPPRRPGLILKPPFGLSTAEVYRRCAPRPAVDLSLYQHGNSTALALQNDLIAPALSLRPELQNYFHIIEATRPAAYQMSGSGPAIFAFYEDTAARDAAFFALNTQNEVYKIETVPRAQLFSE
ncbi:MAG: 4-(cytidine 5'-diphospho)-2-C-methyl-D-erythritol kinase [Candidatus Margulisbacteria bacterium]|nr:4-(cytidine 5'-diphospho)-2-C-methyl-D-erythritol kinase [Candidatus Margulisiibacteriota bacterium]